MKTRSKDLMLSYIVGISFGIIVYIIINSLIYSVIFGVIMFLLINFYTLKKLSKTRKFLKAVEVFSHFANSLVMQLTVMPNVSRALIDISDYLDSEKQSIITNEELLINERLDALDKHFDFPLYYVFKEIIVLYDTQGGSIIDMSMQLLNQIDIYMKNIETIRLDNNKKIGEVLFLWIFSIFALIYVKSILIDYYSILISNNTFVLVLAGFFLLFIFSIFILSNKYIEIKLGD